jgi:carbamoyl-phosphate synthase large subunit
MNYMKKQEKPKKVLVIGSGPIVIGQAAEFDYSGTQACQALREEGVKVVLVNSNPATIQTDHEIADIVYIEPLTCDFLEKIIERERPDALLATVGGQTALNLAVELGKKGVLEKFNVRVIGTDLEAIENAESRKKFNDVMRRINLPILPSFAAKDYEEAYAFAERIGYPVILRPAFTLGGTGGGVANNKNELKKLLDVGFRLSATHEVLVEKSVIGWGEFEYEVIRDNADNAIIVCNMENFDPMGVHTGESIVVAPSQTLNDREHQMLRNAALKIVRALNIRGSCNVQFALNQETGEFVVIEVNPRLSRSSALASKATGYPIARVATKIALGYNLNEIKNAITLTSAAFEPALDYCVVKIPKWPFEKFLNVDRKIGTQMKSTGEVMAIGRTFEEALMKAIRSLEIKLPSKIIPEEHLYPPTDMRLFAIFEAFRKNRSVEEVHKITKINKWFLEKIKKLVELEREISENELDEQLLRKAKRYGFSDLQIAKLKNKSEDEIRLLRKKFSILPVYKSVDSCAGEFEAVTPYYYSTYEDENEATELDGRRIVVIGSGPIRIGQGIEFDYCCSHAVFALRELGIKSIMINNNPETVSTDFDSSDRLYFEPLTFEDVFNVIENEKPEGVIVQFGGQTSINLAKKLADNGVRILGTQVEGIDIAEDREKFRKLLNELNIPQPKNGTATNADEAFKIAKEIGYPVVVRPSYVIAGRGMQIVYNEDEMKKFIDEAVEVSESRPVLIDKYLEKAIECEVDVICDGSEFFIPPIMEHIEFAGVHSGDANIVVPSLNISAKLKEKIYEYTKKIALALGTVGLINIQYAIKDDTVYVLEANPRASRTIPFLSKAIGIPMAKIATKILVGDKVDLKKLKPKMNFFAVKSTVFPFLKLHGTDIALGPEMKSIGETMGIARTFEIAYYKALHASGFTIPEHYGKAAALVSLRDEDKQFALSLERSLTELGFAVFATPGTAAYMRNPIVVQKISAAKEGELSVLDVIEGGKISLIINTPKRGGIYQTDGFKIRRAAIERGIQCITNIRTALELIKAMKAVRESEIDVMPLVAAYTL